VIALKQILVATDFSQPSDAALRYGRDLARSYHASLHVLHVVDDLAARVALAPLAVMPNVGNLQTDL
jgi:nucleotide-binding universal stress UspA family protein